MAPNELDQVMTQFADGDADILLSANIVESGIDIPSANTMIIHRADMFGLSQLYQLRGRVAAGVSEHTHTSHPIHKDCSASGASAFGGNANPRYAWCRSTLASHDMDIRGAGNLLGDEQSGHVREVGLNFIKRCCVRQLMMPNLGVKTMLVKGKACMDPANQSGLEIRFTETYVPDLTVRLSPLSADC